MSIPGFNNNFAVDFDSPGFCALCHTEIAVFNGSTPEGFPIIESIKNNAIRAKVDLNNGTVMGVMLCKNCESELSAENARELMESVQRGWQFEVENRLRKPVNGKKAKWGKKKADDHLKEYRKFFVTDREDFPWSKEDKLKIKKPRKKEQLLRGK